MTNGQPGIMRGHPGSGVPAKGSLPGGSAEPSWPLTAWQRCRQWRRSSPRFPSLAGVSTLLCGGWLMLAQAMWDYGGTSGGFSVGFDARHNDALVGLVVAIVGLARLAERIRLAAANMVALTAGMWLIVAPFALAYGFGADSTRATLNDLVIGLLVVAVTVAGHAGPRMPARPVLSYFRN